MAPARRPERQSVYLGAGLGGVWVFSRGPQASALALAVSTIRARAGRCREGGLSSTDERVRGHVTKVTQTGSSEVVQMVPVSSTRIDSREDLNQTLT